MTLCLLYMRDLYIYFFTFLSKIFKNKKPPSFKRGFLLKNEILFISRVSSAPFSSLKDKVLQSAELQERAEFPQRFCRHYGSELTDIAEFRLDQL